jgi:sigma-B regulation protein RsbU (phosphoserine phosphatase)
MPGDSGERLLVIDDDIKLGHLLKEYLEPLGFMVDLVHSGKDGLAQVMTGGYAAVILDVMMPDMSGFDVLREIRKKSSVPVLMLTGLGAESDRVTGLDVGADDYLVKTVSTTELVARIRAVLRRSLLTKQDHRELQEGREALDEAGDIQRALLPKDIPVAEGYDISGMWLPARSVSGDYYDVFRISPSRFAFCIADVAGKGMPAALLMANLQAAVAALSAQAASPADLCRKVNKLLARHVARGRYITFFYGLIDTKTNRLRYTCAGHLPPFLVTANGSARSLDKGGLVLGLYADASYEMGEVQLVAGDRLVLYTDGLTEAPDINGQEFGMERLVNMIRAGSELTASQLEKTIIDTVRDFSRGEFRDDLTLLTIRVTGKLSRTH